MSKKRLGCLVVMTLVFCQGLSCGTRRADFAEPPLRYRPRPLWFWNDVRVTKEVIEEQMYKSRDLCGYGGFGILPFGKRFSPTYLSEDYFAVYGAALQKAKDLGMTMSLYDEFGFPSGSAGAANSSDTSIFASRWPEQTIKRLDKIEDEIAGPAEYEKRLPSGTLMGVVAMETTSKVRIDLTETVHDGLLTWQAPAGNWKVMTFVCVKDGDPICDYLDPDAADKFIEITHQAYYDRFAKYFGTTIDSTFFDEPTLYRAEGRTWTDKFNDKFIARYGFNPRVYYPALWYDIGAETQAARNYLFGFRSELYATGFTKRIQDWCDAHRIAATGHQDQEEVVNPVSVSGDLMKCFKYLDIPGIDKIGGDRPAERFYKIISSAAYNWDKSLVMSETYGAMGNLSWDEMYAVAMEQYTKGINMLIPHAVWYNDKNVIYKPELSWRNPIYADRLHEFSDYLGRLNVMLQNDAAHVADIAVLYPIATMQAGHVLDGPLGNYKGGVAIPEADYVEVGEMLTGRIGRDFTFIHPQVLDEKCKVEGPHLFLPNTIHPGFFSVFILPGHKTIYWSNLRKIKSFYDQGGCVIATGRLPYKSAEFGHDGDVVQTIEAMFGSAKSADYEYSQYEMNQNSRGGRAIRLRKADAETLQKALDAAGIVYDVTFESGSPLRYIHKTKDNVHLYFFANLSPDVAETVVALRGKLSLQAWDPHTGKIYPVKLTHTIRQDTDITRLNVTLPGLKSIFLVSS